jgi:hypothetical protein
MIAVKKCIGRTVLWVLGWRAEAVLPDEPKFIVLGHPHTSTWDFPLFILTSWALGIPMQWIGKQSLFQGPMDRLYRALGGLPVDRSGGKDVVQSVADLFATHDTLIFGLAPAGTRSYSPHWRSGFYYMALAANVPVVLGSIDFKRRVGCLLETVHLSGDVSADMNRIRAAYAAVEGRNPDQRTPIRLASEHNEA